MSDARRTNEGPQGLSWKQRRALTLIKQAQQANDPAYVVGPTDRTLIGEINFRTAKTLWERGLVVWDNSNDDGTYLFLTEAGWKAVV